MKLKNLVPKNLKGSRWEDFFEAMDSYFTDFKTVKIALLKNKFVTSQSDKTNLRDLVKQKGYDIIELNGYSSTIEFLKRRADNVPLEILWLLSETCYRHTLKSFWYYGNVYGLGSDPDGYYYKINPNTNISSTSTNIQLLDQETDIIFYYINNTPVPNPPQPTYLPAIFLDTEDPPTLDMDDVRDGTNHFLIEYGFYKCESQNVFVSENTSRALYDTIAQIHRLKETPHYRVMLPMTVNTDGSVNEREYESYDGEETCSLKTIYLNGNFNLVQHVEIGNSYHPVIDNTITSCKAAIGTIPVSGLFTINSQSASGLDIEYKVQEYKKLQTISGTTIYTFSEVTFLDTDFNPVAYARIPEINFFDKMYTGVRFQVTCQDV